MLTTIYERPAATTVLAGKGDYQTIRGKVDFFDTYEGTVVVAELTGIPESVIKRSGGFLGFHIHEGGSCTGNAQDPYADAGTHYNPGRKEHPEHAGDLPSIMTNDGNAFMVVYTDRFHPEDVIGKTVILHAMPDDFRSQPSGDSGMKIACGKITLPNLPE